jgi:hypothetical protein
MTIFTDDPMTTETTNDTHTSPPITEHEVIHEVILERVSIGNRGANYSVAYRDQVICLSRDPEFAACRELAKRGLTGLLKTRWKGSPHIAMTMNIAWGAARRTKEGGALRIVRWSPFGDAEDDQEIAVDEAPRSLPNVASGVRQSLHEATPSAGPVVVRRRLRSRAAAKTKADEQPAGEAQEPMPESLIDRFTNGSADWE